MSERALIQFGTAGLGNRLVVLAWCIDKIIKHDMKFYPIWTDSVSWNESFFDKFSLPDNILYDPTKYDPSKLVSKYFLPTLPPCLKNFFRENSEAPADVPALSYSNTPINFIIRDIGEYCYALLEKSIRVPDGIYIMANYPGKYSDSVFNFLGIQKCVIQSVSNVIQTLPEKYTCWHIRDTDKSCSSFGVSIDSIFDAIKNSSKTPVVVTDSVNIKNMATELGICCPSLIPNYQAFRTNKDTGETRIVGVHHYTTKQLEKAGISKDDINMGAVVDMFVAGLAHDFHDTCKGKSAFANFINRGRKNNWFNRQMERLS